VIHYHGMPVSGAYPESTEFSKGRHVLISYKYPQVLECVADTCSSFCIDNRAFSFWKKKQPVDWDKYAAWVGEWSRHPRYDWCLIPDIIDGSEADNKKLVLKYRRLPHAVPVYHMHESLEYLDALCQHFPRVALGSSGEWAHPNTTPWWGRMTQMLEVACDQHGRPRTKLHGLRMLNPKVFTRIPFSSADSTNAGVNAGSKGRFGAYLPAKASLRAAVIASNIEGHNSPSVWVP
jgi:hypothetical protein